MTKREKTPNPDDYVGRRTRADSPTYHGNRHPTWDEIWLMCSPNKASARSAGLGSIIREKLIRS